MKKVVIVEKKVKSNFWELFIINQTFMIGIIVMVKFGSLESALFGGTLCTIFMSWLDRKESSVDVEKEVYIK